jgi:3-oxoacyl-ACP reductase-like protein
MAAAVVAADSPTKITANPRASPENPAGSSVLVAPIQSDLRGGLMSVTFQKRQKEMKRREKQQAKAAKRAQRKDARRAIKETDAATSPSPDAATVPEPPAPGDLSLDHG